MAGKTKMGQFLKSRGSTQGEAAKLLGISQAAFSNKAKGAYEFKASEIKKLVERYGMTECEIRELFL